MRNGRARGCVGRQQRFGASNTSLGSPVLAQGTRSGGLLKWEIWQAVSIPRASDGQPSRNW